MASLTVLDMGLDFKTYATYRDDHGRPLLGNQFQYPTASLARSFHPTCGLLVGVLHHAIAQVGTPLAQSWLDAYRLLQIDFVSQHPSNAAAATSLQKLNQGRCDSGVIEELLILLDQQTGLSGNNMPSQRRPTRDPKLALCNLHMAAGKCNQDFLCNQLHIKDLSVPHRAEFFAHLADVLRHRKNSEDVIMHRMKDALFFSRFGNRVTVSDVASQAQFFKTSFTIGRLLHALSLPGARACPAPGVCVSEDCPGVHIPGGTPQHRPLRLSPQEVMSASISLEEDAMAFVKGKVEASPTTLKWNAAVDAFVQHSPQAHRRRNSSDPVLIETLAAAGGSGTLSDEGFTPLIKEVDTKRFEATIPESP